MANQAAKNAPAKPSAPARWQRRLLAVAIACETVWIVLLVALSIIH